MMMILMRSTLLNICMFQNSLLNNENKVCTLWHKLQLLMATRYVIGRDRPRLITDLRMPENHWIQMLIPKWNEETVCPKKNKTEMPNEESPCLLLPTLPKCKKWTADNTGITFIISRQTTSRKV